MTYARNAWYVSAWSHDIVPERPVGVRVLNEPIVIWRNAAGDLTAFEDRCVHRLAPLSLGRCEGGRLRCMYHGWLYDSTGLVVEIPGQDQIPSSLRVRTYPVVERHSWVWVWMGDAAADEALIPPVIGLNHPDYILGHGQLDLAAEASLVNDNLLDLSHVRFLHAESVPLSEEWSRERPKFTGCERGVRTEWWIRNDPLMKPDELCDTYTRSDFYVPGVLVVTDRGYPIGTADHLRGQEPNLDRRAFNVLSHLISPMTDGSTRYFYCVGSHRDYGDDAVCARDALMGIVEKAFAEDKKMIEAQQRNIDMTPGRRFMPATADRGVVLYNRLLEKLAREESAGSTETRRPVSPN